MGGLLAILCLSADTSYAGFPQMCRLVAQGGFLPRPSAVADRRRVFSVGVAFPTVSAAALLIVVGGVTERLIPLFAIGALLTFTLSQRNIHEPLLKFIEKIDADTPGRSVAVLIPELVLTRGWERLLHARRAGRLRSALLTHGGPRLNVMISPWRS